MVQWYVNPLRSSRNGSTVVLTSSGSPVALERFVERLAEQRVSTPTIVEWDALCLSLLDPMCCEWNGGDELCFILLQYEDWDHFADHIRDKSIEPSYDLVRKKVSELIHCLNIAASRLTARFVVAVSWSDSARGCPEVNVFFEEMTRHLDECFQGYDRIAVLRALESAELNAGLLQLSGAS